MKVLHKGGEDVKVLRKVKRRFRRKYGGSAQRKRKVPQKVNEGPEKKVNNVPQKLQEDSVEGTEG